MTDKVFSNMFDENSNLDENEQALLMNDFRRADAHNEQAVEDATVKASLKEVLNSNRELPQSIKDDIKKDQLKHNFYKINNHIMKYNRIKLGILKREDRINLNDVVKYMFAWIAYETAKPEIAFDYTYHKYFDAETISDEINYWNAFDAKWLDEAAMAAFAKHRGNDIKHSMKEFAKMLSTQAIVFPSVCNLYVNLDKTGTVTLVNKLVCAFKFDNRDRDKANNAKVKSNVSMKDFDFDSRRSYWEQISSNSKFEFYTWFASLQTMIYLADHNSSESQENLNVLIKNGLTHVTEIDTILRLLDTDISEYIID